MRLKMPLAPTGKNTYLSEHAPAAAATPVASSPKPAPAAVVPKVSVPRMDLIMPLAPTGRTSYLSESTTLVASQTTDSRTYGTISPELPEPEPPPPPPNPRTRAMRWAPALGITADVLTILGGYLSVHKADPFGTTTVSEDTAAYLAFAAALACKSGEVALIRRAVKIAPTEGGPTIDRHARKVAITAGMGALWAAARAGVNIGNWYRYSASNIGTLCPELATVWFAVMGVAQTQSNNQVVKLYRDAMDADKLAAETAA